MRDCYNSPREAESFTKFLASEPYDLAWFQNWLNMVREASCAGRQFSRVRVVGVPLTDYSRFGYAMAQHNNAAGEDIRYLARDRAQAAGLPDHDYWLFDSRRLVVMHFGEDDRFLQAEIITDLAVIVEHNYRRDAAWHYAVRRDDFDAEQN